MMHMYFYSMTIVHNKCPREVCGFVVSHYDGALNYEFKEIWENMNRL